MKNTRPAWAVPLRPTPHTEEVPDITHEIIAQIDARERELQGIAHMMEQKPLMKANLDFHERQGMLMRGRATRTTKVKRATKAPQIRALRVRTTNRKRK